MKVVKDMYNRTIFLGDVVDMIGLYRVIGFEKGFLSLESLNFYGYRKISVDSKNVVVNLELSKGRSNYERYFQEFGSLSQVVSAVYDEADENLSSFDYWNDGEGRYDAVNNFIDWLQSRAMT